MTFEYTSEEMARKLMEFNRDFADTEEEIESEIPYLIETFDKLKESADFNALAHHLDLMFMNSVFR